MAEESRSKPYSSQEIELNEAEIKEFKRLEAKK
jgi:hypothetical protein